MAGDFTVSRLRAAPIPNTGDKWLATWRCDDAGSSAPAFLVYVGGTLYAITQQSEQIVQIDPDDDALLEVIAATPAHSSNVFSTTKLGTGNKATLAWSSPVGGEAPYAYRIRYGQASSALIDTVLHDDAATSFSWESSRLANGTWYYKVCPVDAAGNENLSGSWSSVAIATRPYPPSDFAVSWTSPHATFTWDNPASLDAIRLYLSSFAYSSNAWLDYTTSYVSLGAVEQYTASNLSCPATYVAGVRAGLSSVYEANTERRVRFRLNASGVLMDGLPNSPQSFSATPRADGTIRLKCVYDSASETGAMSAVRFYRNSGGAAYPTTLITSVAKTGAIGDLSAYYYDVTGLTASTSYRFLAKAVTANGTQDDNGVIVTATPDATAPNSTSATATASE